MRAVRGLVLASHPLPCLAVTAFAAAYAAAIHLAPARVLLLAVAVLLGQLSIGWLNDTLDAARDTAAGRADKPVAAGLISGPAVGAAAAAALSVCAPLSVQLGREAGAVNLVCVAGGWAYDLGLKSTPASPVPYLVSFGLLPAVATWARPDGGWPSPGVVAGAALLGAAAHFANTVGDVAADAATGVRGLPQRLGPRTSLVLTAAGVTAAAVVLGAGLPDRGPLVVALLGLGALLSAGAAVGAAALRGRRVAFRLTLLAVAAVVAGFVAGA